MDHHNILDHYNHIDQLPDHTQMAQLLFAYKVALGGEKNIDWMYPFHTQVVQRASSYWQYDCPDDCENLFDLT